MMRAYRAKAMIRSKYKHKPKTWNVLNHKLSFPNKRAETMQPARDAIPSHNANKRTRFRVADRPRPSVPNEMDTRKLSKLRAKVSTRSFAIVSLLKTTERSS